MTYCLGIRVRDGLVCLADGRITSGNQVTSARKISLHGPPGNQFCIMTSGLRSLRDKTLAHLDLEMKARNDGYPTLLKAIADYCACLRAVAEEDKEALAESNLDFNLHALLAGQLAEDSGPSIYLVYPEGNWIQVGERTPYLSIGAVAYGKPILDRALRFDTRLATAIKLAYLSFDSTRYSSADVGFPIDIYTRSADDGVWRQSQYDYDDMVEQRTWWNTNLTRLAQEMPDGPWTAPLLPEAGGVERIKLIAED